MTERIIYTVWVDKKHPEVKAAQDAVDIAGQFLPRIYEVRQTATYYHIRGVRMTEIGRHMGKEQIDEHTTIMYCVPREK